MRKFWPFVLGSLLTTTLSSQVWAFSVTLPDQKQVRIESLPPLEARKLSRLTLIWPADSGWRPVALDAEMPEHKHGMNVKPSDPLLVPGQQDRYQVHGVKLHMPGLWIFRLQVKNSQGELRWVDQTLTLDQR